MYLISYNRLEILNVFYCRIHVFNHNLYLVKITHLCKINFSLKTFIYKKLFTSLWNSGYFPNFLVMVFSEMDNESRNQFYKFSVELMKMKLSVFHNKFKAIQSFQLNEREFILKSSSILFKFFILNYSKCYVLIVD